MVSSSEQLFEMKMQLRASISAESAKLYNVDNKANVMFGYATDRGFKAKIVYEVLNDRERFNANLRIVIAEIAKIKPLFWDYDLNGILEQPNNDAIDAAVKWLRQETKQHSLLNLTDFIEKN